MTDANIKHVSDRIDYLDIARGIGILLVVIGHHLDGFPGFTVWIYSFHMPLFFILSGWLYAHKKPEISIKSLIKKKAGSLIYPYWVFSALIVLWKVLLYIGLDSMPDESFEKLLWKSLSTYGYHALWFLHALFWTELIVHQVETKYTATKKKSAIIYCLIIFVGFSISEYRKIYEVGQITEFVLRYIGRVCIAVMYYKIGIFLYKWNSRATRNVKNSVLVICFAASVFLSEYNGLVNMSIVSVGNFPLYVLLGTCGSLAVILFSQIIGRNTFLSFWGKNSLFVMCTHMDFSAEIIWILMAQTGITAAIPNYSFQTVIMIALELPLLAAAAYIVNRYFPFLLSLPKTKKQRTLT